MLVVANRTGRGALARLLVAHGANMEQKDKVRLIARNASDWPGGAGHHDQLAAVHAAALSSCGPVCKLARAPASSAIGQT